jgi:hypothetical protein
MDDWVENQRINFLEKTIIPGNFSKSELEEGIAFFAAQFFKYKTLVEYLLENNKELVENAEHKLAKTGLYSGQLTYDEEKLVFQAFDAGIKVSKTNSAQVSARASHKEDDEAKKWLLTEWIEHCVEYEHNKAYFARDYVRLLAHKFKDKKGDPLKRTEAFVTNALPKTNNPGRKKKTI